LVNAVGPDGRIVGVDLSPDMIAAARERVRRRGWSRIELIESAAENLHLDEPFDALLLFAMHDVFTSAEGLDRCLSHVRTGGRVVAVGPALAAGRLGRVVNPALGAVFRRFSVSSIDRDQPWRLLAERIPELRVERFGPGVLFMARGEIR
jgi:demethylmenaquinone methyltransferase/2-methoxy-6-polyprenyl-1,4-benzoquinol methylase